MKRFYIFNQGKLCGTHERLAAALATARQKHAQRIAFWTFCQWCFYRQWLALKQNPLALLGLACRAHREFPLCRAHGLKHFFQESAVVCEEAAEGVGQAHNVMSLVLDHFGKGGP